MTARTEGWIVSVILYGSVMAVLLFFYVPILTLIAFSFQEGTYFSIPFDGVSLRWYDALFDHKDFKTAAINSTVIALAVTTICTVIGTGAALAWVRYAFRFKRVFQALVVAPLIFPQLLLAIMLLLWFSVLGEWLEFSTGLHTVIIGQTVYIAPFAAIIISVQLHAFDNTLEDAARDCGASTWQVYREITLPLLWPSVSSAAIFSFLLSWGNFYITYSLSGTARTLPTFIFSGIALGTSSPIYPALATIIFVLGLVLVFFAERYRRHALGR